MSKCNCLNCNIDDPLIAEKIKLYFEDLMICAGKMLSEDEEAGMVAIDNFIINYDNFKIAKRMQILKAMKEKECSNLH